MSPKIIILNTNNQPDASFSVSGVFWLSAPSAFIIPLPYFKSQVSNITAEQISLLHIGTVVEQEFNTGLYPSGTELSSVKADLQNLFNEAQTNINNLAPISNGFIGAEFDGTNWALPSNVLNNQIAVAGVAPAKGLGGFSPDPRNNNYQPLPDEVVSLYVDVFGALLTRGQIFTDEGSVRDDFTGSSLESNLTGTLTFTNGSNIVSGVSTLFTSELNRDNYIRPINSNTWYSIIRAPNDTSCLIDPVYSGSTISSSAEKTRWITGLVGISPGSVALSNSQAVLSSGTSNNCGVNISRSGDYLPLLISWTARVSQRISNQTAYLGLRDDVNNPSMYAEIVFDGYDNKVIKFRSAWNIDEQISTITLPSGLNTGMQLRYKIDVSAEYCGLSVNGVLVIKHENHIPDPYTDLTLCAGILNTSNSVTNTNLVIDTMFFSNQDQVQINNTFLSPIPVISKEDQHTISSTITTTSTTSNQEILSYLVPDGKVFYLIGYRIECLGNIDGEVKLGKNNLTQISNNEIDGNLFRNLFISKGDNTGEIDFSTPRKMGVGGDYIKIAVTPKGSSKCSWDAILDFVLR